jgi:hypothetical protein
LHIYPRPCRAKLGGHLWFTYLWAGSPNNHIPHNLHRSPTQLLTQKNKQTESGSELSTILETAIPQPAEARSRLLEGSAALARAHRAAAERGDTTAPDARENVDLHFVCFATDAGGRLWELDGRRKGPLLRLDAAGAGAGAGAGDGDGPDVLAPDALRAGPLNFLDRAGDDLRFSCLVLAPSLDGGATAAAAAP